MLVLLVLIASCSKPFPEADSLRLLVFARAQDWNKYIFITTATHDGNFASGFATAIAGADDFCAQQKSSSAPWLPGFSAEYRALLTDGATRRASLTADVGDGQTGWVLAPNTTYYRPDGMVLFTTNAVALYNMNTGLRNPFTSDASAAARWWTGLDLGWETLLTCSSWTSSVANGTRGQGGTTTNASLSAASNGGGTPIRLLCVRQ